MNNIKKISLKKINVLLAFVIAVLLIQMPFTTTTQTTHAGGPLALCNVGVPYLWANGGMNIPFNPDQGDLGPLTNAAATTLVQESFDVWAAVPTATTTYTNAGQLPVDVDFSNYGPYLNSVAPDGLSAIVFDDTGEIFDFLYGPNSGILGFAGPEWGTPAQCRIDEGYSFLNGPAFTDPTYAKDVMVHEFGHYTNLAHTVVNGQIGIGDNTGPTPNDTFPGPVLVTSVETMYPFYFGPGSGTQTLHQDDIGSVSTLYPAATFATTTAAISGTIYAPDGTTPVSGVNVIARNVANPFDDAVSAISGDFAVPGTYKIEGLTPGANYAVYVDEILAGGFSTTPLTPLPGPEEFYSGATESNFDDPTTYMAVPVSAGNTVTGVNIIFNTPRPGDPLAVGDDGFVEISLPFSFEICQQSFNSVFVNANGNLTFGAPDGDFSESAAEFLAGLPRIAGLWDDLNPTGGGTVTYYPNTAGVTFYYNNIPEFPSTGSNTFSITLKRPTGSLGDSDKPSKAPSKTALVHDSTVQVIYGNMTAIDGIGGISCGGTKTSGFETPIDLSSLAGSTINLNTQAAAYEVWNAGNPRDIGNSRRNNILYYNSKTNYSDQFEPNNSIRNASQIALPFNSIPVSRYTSIGNNDVDYYGFYVQGGDTLVAEVLTGQLDSILGLFDESGTLVAFNDDGGNGLLSRLVYSAPATARYTLAVSTFPDGGFTGGNANGNRYVLDVKTQQGFPITLGDDDSEEIALPFAFPFNGNTYNSVFVNSNGNLTFGSGDTDFSESIAEMRNDQPRIAPLWDDLSPNNGGSVVAQVTATKATITFDSVPEFISTGANTFSVTLYPSGKIDVSYGAISATDGLAGVSPGGGVTDNGGTNLSASSTYPAMGLTYELFNGGNPNDLSGLNLSYLP